MVIVFKDFAVDASRLPDGGLELRFLEAMEGIGEDGGTGIVATGEEFAVVMDREQALNYVIEISVAMGFMKDQNVPDVADMSTMREELEKRKSKGKKRRQR